MKIIKLAVLAAVVTAGAAACGICLGSRGKKKPDITGKWKIGQIIEDGKAQSVEEYIQEHQSEIPEPPQPAEPVSEIPSPCMVAFAEDYPEISLTFLATSLEDLAGMSLEFQADGTTVWSCKTQRKNVFISGTYQVRRDTVAVKLNGDLNIKLKLDAASGTLIEENNGMGSTLSIVLKKA